MGYSNARGFGGTDGALLDVINSEVPKMNKDICNGLATIQMKAAETHIRNVWKVATNNLLPGLSYLGTKRCTPEEEFAENIRKNKARARYIDVARSDYYKIKSSFNFNGTPINVYQSILFVGQAGRFHLRGSEYQITPAIGGAVYNIESDKMFMDLIRDRMTFESIPTALKKNRRVIHSKSVTSGFWKVKKPSDKSKYSFCMAHYLFAKYGLRETFKRFFDVEDVKIGGLELMDYLDNPDWCVYTTAGINPKEVANNRDFQINPLHIAIPTDKSSLFFDTLMGALFYIVDRCSTTVTVEDAESTELWTSLMHRFIFRTPGMDVGGFEKMEKHLINVTQYIDPLVKQNLNQNDIMVNDFFEFTAYMVKNFNDIMVNTKFNSMYDKELKTMKHVMYPVVNEIFNLMFDFQSKGPIMTKNAVEQAFRKIQQESITRCTSTGVVNTNPLASECMLIGGTNLMVPQSKASSSDGSNHGSKLASDNILIDSSLTQVSTARMPSKSDPSSRSCLSPFVTTNKNAMTVCNIELEERDAILQQQINE